MGPKHTRQEHRTDEIPEFFILVFEEDTDFAQILKFEIEKKLPVEVVTVDALSNVHSLLEESPDKFFLSVINIEHLDSANFEKIDMLAEFNIPAIVIVEQYQDELRDQIIKRHVIDYVVKDGRSDIGYICDLIERTIKNNCIRVLVVDDSKVAQFIISRELALQKFEVTKVESSAEALDALEESEDIKLVLVDYQMKSTDGVTFVRQARKIYPKDQLLIIGTSTSQDPRLAVKFLKAGANDFISKPFNHEMMLCRINQNLDMLDAIDLAKRLSNIDYLSDVFNRRYFFEHGESMFRELQDKNTLTVAMVDIDYFKKINDVYGHDVGDEVIKYIGDELKRYFEGDVVARLGGEEFAVLSSCARYRDSFAHIDAFRQKIADKTFYIKGNEIKFTCSIGITNISVGSLDEMMVHADRLLYKAKQGGRNRCEGIPSN